MKSNKILKRKHIYLCKEQNILKHILYARDDRNKRRKKKSKKQKKIQKKFFFVFSIFDGSAHKLC